MARDLEKHFSMKEKAFFETIKPFLEMNDAVLKIGNGFGYLSTYIADYVAELKILEINVFEKTINKEQVILYDGKTLPVSDKSYDVAIFNLVFHHIPHNQDFLRQTIQKTRRYVILYEQTYDNIFQKINLVWRDWYINKKAGTPSRLYWNSYLRRKNVERFIEKLDVEIVHRTTKRSHMYFKELIVLEVQIPKS
ncbi:MAG: methyltransferase domain-containing protein [Candidatus Saccharimonas sp.]